MSKKTFIFRIKSLLANPQENMGKIIPYLKSRLFYNKKRIFEAFGNDRWSKPYPGHDELLKYLPQKNGFFVEAGGNDGYFQDPTYFLEKFRGWTGIIIEPTPIAQTCQKNRKKSLIKQKALVSFDYPKKSIIIADCNAMSIIKDETSYYKNWVEEGERCQHIKAEEIEVPAENLTNLLDDYFKNKKILPIDLLVLDVEGYELNVLKGLDLKKYSPRYLLIEINKPSDKEKIEEYLGNNYLLLEVIGHNDYLYKLK